ncbi:MAG: succinate dehydrogenase assembly factor 2 [Burkholderiales bacterium]|nr:succinate dehydrogenase assembly factor 2 [Burkholderiales bacterium]
MNSFNHQSDASQRARLRWRARRGLLENDLIIQRFFDRHELELSDEDVEALTELFEMTDNELLEVILARKELEGGLDTPAVHRVVKMLRDV